MPQIDVRLCTPDDVAQLRPHEPRPDSHFADEHFSEQEAGDYSFVTAWDDDEPLGWGVLTLRNPDLSPQLAHLWVFPEARRQGAGRAIAEWIEQRARELGYSSVFLRVDPDNAAAIPLWIDLGYSPTGEHDLATDDATGQTSHHAIYRKSLTINE